MTKAKRPAITGSAKKDRYEAWADALYSQLPAKARRKRPPYTIRFVTQQLANDTWRIAATLPDAMVEQFGREKFLEQAASAWEVSLTRTGLTLRLRKAPPT